MDQREYARLETRDGQTVNLMGVKLSGDLRGLMFEANVEQRFCNPTDNAVEIVYSFPLPWGAVLLGVDVVLGNKTLTGVVSDKRRAQARYEEAVSEGNSAIMLERNHDHSYSLNLGNLAAGEDCVITLRYAQALQFEQRGLRLLIPTVIAPRYGDMQRQGGLLPHQVPDHSLVTDLPFELELRLHGELALARVASPSHHAGFAHMNADQRSVLTVSLVRRESLDRDFALVIDQLAHDAVAVAAQDCVKSDRVAVLASFCPRFRTQDIPATAVKIVVDCSGSMAGDSIDAAKRALQAIIQQLGAGDRFSLSRFGSSVEHRSRGLWKASETTVLAARRWIGALTADLGGTEMEAALLSVFTLAQTVSSDVLLVTDGEISAIDSTIDAAKASGHRLFVVGIGSSPAETHLRRLAHATGGACDFVAPGEAVEPAVLRMFARLRSPQWHDLNLKWPEGMVPDWASPLPLSVFDGDTMNVFAMLGQAPIGEVRLMGKRTRDGDAEVVGCVTLSDRLERADTLSRMAASAWFHATAGDASMDRSVDKVRLAVDYQLVTDKTNFLLVHERSPGEKVGDMPELQKVAQMVPAGWGGTGSVLRIRGGAYFETRVIDYQPGGALDWSDADASPAPASVSTPVPVQKMFHVATKSSVPPLVGSGFAIPDFLRRKTPIIDRHDARYWTDSETYLGLTPWGVSEWLLASPATQWPMTYIGLHQMGVGKWVVDWLELVMAVCDGTLHAESRVVEAFLFLMSGQNIREWLLTTEHDSGTVNARALRTAGSAERNPEAQMIDLDAPLVEAMAVALTGMTAYEWPEQVFSMSEVIDCV